MEDVKITGLDKTLAVLVVFALASATFLTYTDKSADFAWGVVTALVGVGVGKQINSTR